MIRILHTADWHLGQTFFGYDRTEEQLHFLDWLAGELREKGFDALLIAGDVFDVSNPSAAAQRMFYHFIHRVTEENPRLQIVAIAGNHDSPARLEAPLPLLQEMRTVVKGIVLKENGETDYDHLIVELKNSIGEVEALCMAVPYLRQGDYPVMVSEGNPYAEGVRELYGQLFRRALSRCTARQAIVAMGHLQATGSEIAERDYSERTVIGGLECVAPDVFPERIAYTALGHIHKSQRVSGRENVRYAGSPLSMSFAEKNYHHGVVSVTIDEGWAVQIDKLEYTPPVKLISVPSGKAAGINEVFGLLGELPVVSNESSDFSGYPYLEIKVLLTGPEPALRQQIEDILADKAVRLARIVSVYHQGIEEEPADQVLTTGLQDMSPLQIVKATFEDIYQGDMPEELEQLFKEVVEKVVNEESKT